MPSQKIDDESRRAKQLRIDIDKHRYKYRTFEVDADSGTSVMINFVSPAIFVYEQFRFYLLQNSVLKDLKPEHFYRPDYLAYEEYGYTILWSMLLYINDIPNIESFIDLEKLYIPRMDAIYRVANNTIFDEPLNVTPVISLSKRMSSQIYTQKSKPELIEQPEFVAVENEDDFYFLRENYTVTNAIASKQYIDINFDAVPQSVSFKIQDHAAFIYDRDYVVTKNSSGKLKRISWDKRNVSGDGLLDVIEEGMNIEIQYAKKL